MRACCRFTDRRARGITPRRSCRGGTESVPTPPSPARRRPGSAPGRAECSRVSPCNRGPIPLVGCVWAVAWASCTSAARPCGRGRAAGSGLSWLNGLFPVLFTRTGLGRRCRSSANAAVPHRGSGTVASTGRPSRTSRARSYWSTRALVLAVAAAAFAVVGDGVGQRDQHDGRNAAVNDSDARVPAGDRQQLSSRMTSWMSGGMRPKTLRMLRASLSLEQQQILTAAPCWFPPRVLYAWNVSRRDSWAVGHRGGASSQEMQRGCGPLAVVRGSGIR
jgi:hypothetical protein